VIWHGHVSLKLKVWRLGCNVIEYENVFREWLGKQQDAAKICPDLETEMEYGRKINEPKLETGKNFGRKFNLPKLYIENIFLSQKTQA